MTAMVTRWLTTTPEETEKTAVLKESSAEAIAKAASLARMNAFNKLNAKLNAILEKVSRKNIGENIVKEIETLRAVRQEAEQLLGPFNRAAETESAAPTMNMQLMLLTQLKPEEKRVSGTELPYMDAQEVEPSSR